MVVIPEASRRRYPGPIVTARQPRIGPGSPLRYGRDDILWDYGHDWGLR